MSRKAWDALCMFASAVTTNAAAGYTAAATVNLTGIDLGAADTDEFMPGEIQVHWHGITSAGAATITFLVEDSADGITYATIFTSEAYAKTAAELLDWRFTLPSKNLRQYVRLSVTVGGFDLTAGTLTAGLVK